MQKVILINEMDYEIPDIQGYMAGDEDYPVTDLGILRAKITKTDLPSTEDPVILTSPLQRCRMAAEEIFINIAHYAYKPETGKAIVRVEVEEPVQDLIQSSAKAFQASRTSSVSSQSRIQSSRSSPRSSSSFFRRLKKVTVSCSATLIIIQACMKRSVFRPFLIS